MKLMKHQSQIYPYNNNELLIHDQIDYVEENKDNEIDIEPSFI